MTDVTSMAGDKNFKKKKKKPTAHLYLKIANQISRMTFKKRKSLKRKREKKRAEVLVPTNTLLEATKARSSSKHRWRISVPPSTLNFKNAILRPSS